MPKNISDSEGKACQIGFRPSASNCRLQGESRSRRRSMLMPRGKRPSTADLTSCGARKASEGVRLTWRTVHRSRFANCSASVTEPVTMSSSHRRPRAMAPTRRARRSAHSGRMVSRTVPCGGRILRNRLEGGFCQGTDKTSGSEYWSPGFIEITSCVLGPQCARHGRLGLLFARS
jgi:hypothetical protein